MPPDDGGRLRVLDDCGVGAVDSLLGLHAAISFARRAR